MSVDFKPSLGPPRIVEPTVKFIGQLLEDLRSGLLFIPRFQRGDVWDDEDRLELLDSIETLIPIGSIMIWRTQLPMTTRRRIGGHLLPTPPDQPPNATRDYVLDGLQRLSTLLRTLAPIDNGAVEPGMSFDEDDSGPGPIYYDLREGKFHVRGREAEELWHLPTTVLLHTVPLLGFQRRLSESAIDDRDELIQKADRLANSFRTYKVPAVWLVTNRLEDATQAFHRINSKGAKMSEVHMLNALTYSDHFDLEKELLELRPTLAAVGWEALDSKYLLATVRAMCGLDVTQPNAVVLQNEIKQNPHRIKQAVDALARAAELLKTECCVPSPFWLPYTYQAVFLAYALREPIPSKDVEGLKKRLAGWFWRTAYTDYLRIGSRYQLQIATMQALDRMRDGTLETWRDTNGMRVETLPVRLNFRTARAKILGLRFAMQRPRDFATSEELDVRSLLALHENDAFSYLVGRVANLSHINSPENRLLYPPGKWEISRSMMGLIGAPETNVLASHTLDEKCIELLSDNQFARCLERRRILLFEREATFLNELGLEPTQEINRTLV